MTTKAIFERVSLTWQGKDYVIEPSQVLGAIATIEDFITMPEMHAAAVRGTVPVARMAMAYGALLRYAGCAVSDDEVYDGMYSGKNPAKAVFASCRMLMELMTPPEAKRAMAEALKKGKDLGAGEGGAAPAAPLGKGGKNRSERRKDRSSSRRRSRRPTSGASSPPSSGASPLGSSGP